MNRQSADELEQADLLQENERAAGLARVRQQLVEQHKDFDGVHCVGCGDVLPPVRIAYKRVRCAECQTEVERRERLMGRGR